MTATGDRLPFTDVPPLPRARRGAGPQALDDAYQPVWVERSDGGVHATSVLSPTKLRLGAPNVSCTSAATSATNSVRSLKGHASPSAGVHAPGGEWGNPGATCHTDPRPTRSRRALEFAGALELQRAPTNSQQGAHNPKVAGSNPAPAMKEPAAKQRVLCFPRCSVVAWALVQ